MKESVSSEDYEDDLFDEKDLPIDLLWMRYLTEVIFFLCNLDPFAIYKGSHRQSSRPKYERYLKADLRISLNKVDIWRSRFSKLSLCWLSYLLLKYTFLCSLQVIIYSVLLSSCDNTSDVDDLIVWINETASSQESSSSSSSSGTAGEYFDLFLKLKTLSELCGNILSDYPGIAILVYLSLFISVSFSVCFLPHYYYEKPMDSPTMRFGFGPLREIRRADALIKETLATHLTRIKRRETDPASPIEISPYVRRKQPRIFGSHSQHIRQVTNSSASWLAATLMEEKTLRPLNYMHKYYVRLWSLVRPFAYTLSLVMSAFFLKIELTLFHAAISIRCSAKHIDPCDPFKALSLPDWASLVEIFAQAYITGSIVTLQLIMIMTSAVSQLMIVAELKSELNYLLDTLRLANERAHIASPCYCIDHGQQWVPVGSVEPPKSAERETVLPEALLRTLIKCSLQSRDLKSNALFMSEQASSILGILGCMLLLALLTGRMKVIDVHGLRSTIIVAVWCAANLVLIRCAHVYARILQINATTWPIVAQLVIRSADKSRFVAGSDTCEYLASSWLRLALGQGLVDLDNSVRPFGVSLTFKKVLEINFFLVSLVALLRPDHLR